MGVVSLRCAEQSLKGVVSRDDEASSVDQELASDVEEDESEVKSTDTKDEVHLWHRSLLLELVEGRILGQLGIR